MKFEWDNNNEASNIKKHGISFVAAAELLLTSHYEVRSDRNNEIRYMAIGELNGQILTLIYTRREDKYRIISVRKASKHEEETHKKYCQL